MKHFIWILFCFIPCISIGQDKLPKKASVEFLAVRKAMDSLVTIAVPINPGERLFQLPLTADSPIPLSTQNEFYGKKFFRVNSPPPMMETTGFIAQDKEGNIGVIVGFHLIDRAVYIDKEKSLFVYNNKNQGFPVKEIKNISPENNLVFLTVEGDLTEEGKRTPLPLAESYNANEQLFYTLRMSSGGLWFNAKAVQSRISISNREDFLITDAYRNTVHSTEVIGEPVVNQTPIINQKGEVVSFASNGSDHTLYGVPLQNLREFLNSSENCSSFIRGCVMETKKALYEQAQSGNSKAMYILMLSASESFEAFKTLMHSIGITDPTQIKTEHELFWEGATEWNPELYYQRVISDEDISEKERNRHLKFLEQKSSAKTLAEEEHPHFQYLLGNIHFYLNDEHQTEYWLNKSVENGYIPGLWRKMNWHLARSLGNLTALADQNYAPAKRFLSLLSHDFEEAENFLKNHNTDIPHFPKVGHSRGFFQHLKDVWQGNISSATKATSIFELSVFFSENMNHMTKSFELLNKMIAQGYVPAEKLQGRLKKHMAQRELKIPNYPLSGKVEQECEKTYSTYFVPAPAD